MLGHRQLPGPRWAQGWGLGIEWHKADCQGQDGVVDPAIFFHCFFLNWLPPPCILGGGETQVSRGELGQAGQGGERKGEKGEPPPLHVELQAYSLGAGG